MTKKNKAVKKVEEIKTPEVKEEVTPEVKLPKGATNISFEGNYVLYSLADGTTYKELYK